MVFVATADIYPHPHSFSHCENEQINKYCHAVNLCAKSQFIQRQLRIYGPIALFNYVYFSLKVSEITWYGQLILQNNMGSWAEHKHSTCYVKLPMVFVASADIYLPCVG